MNVFAVVEVKSPGKSEITVPAKTLPHSTSQSGLID